MSGWVVDGRMEYGPMNEKMDFTMDGRINGWVELLDEWPDEKVGKD